MTHGWNQTILKNESHAFKVLTELRGNLSYCRGQSKNYGTLIPSIDREKSKGLNRAGTLALERQSIDVFRRTARYFADEGEKNALYDDDIALMVLRHYGVPTRLLDWTTSPQVAAYFAACHNFSDDGELWTFDQREYMQKGALQWARWPETTTNGKDFKAAMTAFQLAQPPDWFVCQHYYVGFPRQTAQEGCYSETARFDRDHAQVIQELLSNKLKHHLYIVPKRLKKRLLSFLLERHGISRVSLFPDSAGAAETAKMVFA